MEEALIELMWIGQSRIERRIVCDPDFDFDDLGII
jgi:hypothetical protein